MEDWTGTSDAAERETELLVSELEDGSVEIEDVVDHLVGSYAITRARATELVRHLMLAAPLAFVVLA